MLPSHVVQRIVRVSSERALANVLLDHGPRLFSAHAAGFYALSDDGRASEVHLRNLPDGFLETYERHGRGIDPVLDWVARNHAPTHTAHALREGEWFHTTLYRELGRRFGGDHYMLVPVLVDGAMVGTMNLARRRPAAPFDVRDLVDAMALCAHVSSRMTALRLATGGMTKWSAVLTARELDVAELVAKGLTNLEIGRILGVSPNTIKKVLKNTFHKLGCERRAELAGVLAASAPDADPPRGTRSGT